MLAHLVEGFEVEVPDVDETLPDRPLGPAIEAVARRKAEAVHANHPEAVVLAADTLVAHEGEALGQPGDEDAARDMLERLAGARQDVVTGVAVVGVGSARSGHAVTRVVLDLDPPAIERYLATGAWRGKAGAYGLQDPIIRERARFTGSWSNVVGLPLELTVQLLEGAGVATKRTDGLSLHNAFSERPE